jgi:hypothetical protein
VRRVHPSWPSQSCGCGVRLRVTAVL